MSDHLSPTNYIDLAADIVAAYVSKNSVPQSDLPALIESVHSALRKTAQGSNEAPEVELTPAVSVRKSITPDYITCLEDGKRFKSLKRHLRTKFNLTPNEYRARWKLPSDYPMVAPNYAQARSAMARSMGLGQKRPAPRRRPKKAA